MGKKKYTNTTPIFRLKPIRQTNECKVQHVGYFTHGDKLGDEELDIATPKEMIEKVGKNIYAFGEINGYNVEARLFKCNMVGDFLVNNNNLPIYDLCFTYEKKIVKGFLFNVYIEFKIDEDCKKLIDKPAKYYDAVLKGKFSLKFDCDEEMTECVEYYRQNIFDSTLKDITLEYTSKHMKELTSEDMSKILEETTSTVEKKQEFLNSLFDPKPLNFFTSENVILATYLLPLLTHPYVNELIKLALKGREKSRRKKMNVDESESMYELPSKVIKLTNTPNDSGLIDQFFGIEEE